MPFIDIAALPEDRRIYLIVQSRFYPFFDTFFQAAEWQEIGAFRNHRLYVREAKAS